MPSARLLMSLVFNQPTPSRFHLKSREKMCYEIETEKRIAF